MERLAQFVSDSFDTQTSQLENSPPHHLSAASTSSSSSSAAPASAAGTLSPADNIDVEAVDEDGTRPAPHLSHGIRHIILQHQPQMKPVVTSHRRQNSRVVSIVSCLSFICTVSQKRRHHTLVYIFTKYSATLKILSLIQSLGNLQ